MSSDTDLAQALRELFETWLESRSSFRTTVEVQAAWEGWKANTAVAAMLSAHESRAQPASVPDGYFIGGPNASAIVYDLKHAESVIAALCNCTGDDPDDYTVTDLSATPQPPATAQEVCPTCGGSKVDPGGLPVCRDCGDDKIDAAMARE